jgi:CHAD domain-containing protein/adenylate cyclase class IV
VADPAGRAASHRRDMIEAVMIEREIKFRLPEGRDPESVRAAVESAGFRLEPSGTVAHEDRYLETEDWTLYRAGIALRLRAEGHRLSLEAKSLRSLEEESLARTEWAQDAPVGEPPWTELGSGPVAGLLQPLEGLGVVKRLQVRARVRNDRECFRWLRGETLLGSLTVDHVSIPPASFREIEVELSNGSHEALGEVQRAVEERLGLQHTAETKLAAALAAMGEGLPELDERRFALDHADRLLDVAHKTFGRHLGRLLWNEPGARLGVDPDYVHDMRVACRRLRTALEVLAEGFPETLRENLRGELRWIGRGLGAVRDLDVAIAHVTALESEATTFERPAFHIFAQGLSVRRATRRLEMIERLDSERFRVLASQARAWVEAGPRAADSAPEAVTPGYAIAPRIIDHWRRGMKDAYEKAELTMEEPDLHALRIAAKKARYAIEYFAELDGAGAVRRARRIATLQDFLGDHRDATLLLRRMKKYARTVPKKDRELMMGVGSALGSLERSARVRRGDLRLAWERAVKEES